MQQNSLLIVITIKDDILIICLDIVVTLTHAYAVISSATLTGGFGFEFKVIANLCLLFSNLRKGRLHFIRLVDRSVRRFVG